MNNKEILTIAQEVVGNVRVGGNVDNIATLSPWTQSVLASVVGVACDATATARKAALAKISWFGIPGQSFTAGQSATIPPASGGNTGLVTSQFFVGQQLRVSQNETAANFIINNILVGRIDQLVNDGVPAEIFSNLSLAAQVDMDICTTGKPISLNVSSIASTTAMFYGAFGGFTVQGC